MQEFDMTGRIILVWIYLKDGIAIPYHQYGMDGVVLFLNDFQHCIQCVIVHSMFFGCAISPPICRPIITDGTILREYSSRKRISFRNISDWKREKHQKE
jgi:hypothetical protein